MKKITTTLAVLLPAMAAMAVVPQEEQAGRDLSPKFSKNLVGSVYRANSSENQDSFFEGFEARNPSGFGWAANAWLPNGWTQFSRQGNKHMGYGDGFWDLTWLTLSNETVGHLPANDQKSAFEGESFAYIMADVMWGDKPVYPDLGLDYATNHPQDEWLVSPAITPNPEEWFYFQVMFRPGWSLYNRDANDFSGETNLLEVWVTEGEGTTDSEWTKLWSLKDYIMQNYTEEELRADLVSFDSNGYKPVYVNVGDYVGKSIKMAFRYFGSYGHGMAIDNVALGIPMPKPSYTLPAGFFKQQSLTPELGAFTGTHQLLIPFGVEATWANTSEDILTNEWAYDSADGAALTSEAYNLVTPAYTLGKHYNAPVLTGKFESRSATYQTLYSDMQAGGRLMGKGGYDGPIGVASYDFLDPQGTLAQSTDYISFRSDINEKWEMLLGRMPYTVDVMGMGCVYPASVTPYGFDYVDLFAQIVAENGTDVHEETTLVAYVYRLPENEYDEQAAIIGRSVLTGVEINALPAIETGNYKNLRFKFEVPVTVDGNILVLIAPTNMVGEDTLVLPYMKSSDEKVWGNSVVYIYINDTEENGGSYDTFYNLNSFPMSRGHFAGLTMSLGATYSYMKAESNIPEVVELPSAGGEFALDIRAMYAPEEWVVSTDRATKANWVTMTAEADKAETDLYHVTLKFDENVQNYDRESPVYIAQAGGFVALNVHQKGESGILDATVDTQMTVKVAAGKVTVTGVEGAVALYNAAGVKVAEKLAEGTAEFEGLTAGVYIVRNGNNAAKVIL